MSDVRHEVIIIGAGPAGLTAGIYTAREMLDTLLLEKGVSGGLPAGTDLIENYPGFPEGIKGTALMDKFKKQAEKFGVKITEFEEIEKIEPKGKTIIVQTNKDKYTASAVIVASGSQPRKLGVPGEEKFLGKGVSYCATCDGPLFKDRDVAVIGCGNSGLQEGEFLLKYVKSLVCIKSSPNMTGTKILQERLRKEKKASVLLNHALISINGKDFVDSVTAKDRQTGKEKEIKVSGVFIYSGFLPNSQFLQGIVELDDSGYIKTNEDMQTNLPGIYAVGDVRSKKVRQITVACGEGSIAAISAQDYIKELEQAR